MSEFVSKFLLERYQQGDSQAASELYGRYVERILRLAKTQISNLLQAKVDPQDVAQESFLAFFDLADQQQVNWDQEGDLWRLLAGITIKQVQRQAEKFTSAKRSIQSERQLNETNLQNKQDNLAIVELTDLIDSLFHEKPLAKRILLARLAGFNLAEIAIQVGRNERTIRRILGSLKAKLASKFNFQEPLIGQVSLTPDVANGKIENYDLLKLIGVGQFGKIYLAKRIDDKLMVTLKILKKSWIGNRNAEELFTNEIEKLGKLKTLGFISSLDAGTLPNGSWFVVTKYFPGQSLSCALAAEPKTATVTFWLKKITQAVCRLHHHGIAHGDIQPENLIVNEQDAHLIDFGFAAFESHESSFLGGTPGFIAPELKVNFATDIYSLGKVFEYTASRLDCIETSNRIASLAVKMCSSCSSRRPNAEAVSSFFD